MNKSTILVLIVLAQFLGTSLWFASNAVIDDLINELNFPANSVGHLTSAIQFGFITGTLLYAFFNIADKFSPSKVFFYSALFGSIFNASFIIPGLGFEQALISRFAAGFFLAGIYPVGMKIAADHFDKDLGKSLGFLVGALVIGTAFPHFLKAFLGTLPFSYVIISTSILALIGGMLIWIFIPDGPYRKAISRIRFNRSFTSFKIPKFKAAAFGYFGHMWELYTFYAFVPFMIAYFNEQTGNSLSIPIWSFIFIAIGGLGCFTSGVFSLRFHPKILATIALSISGLFCLLSFFVLNAVSPILFVLSLSIWGFMVVADSPLFSTLVARHAIPELKGTSLTIVNCIGFALTIVSIQLINTLVDKMDFKFVFLFLAFGPLFGLVSLWRNHRNSSVEKAY